MNYGLHKSNDHIFQIKKINKTVTNKLTATKDITIVKMRSI